MRPLYSLIFEANHCKRSLSQEFSIFFRDSIDLLNELSKSFVRYLLLLLQTALQEICGNKLTAIGFSCCNRYFRARGGIEDIIGFSAIDEPTTFTIPRVFTPFSLQRRRATGLSAVSPDWLMMIVRGYFLQASFVCI